MPIAEKTPAEEGRGRIARPGVGERQNGRTRESGAGVPVRRDSSDGVLPPNPERAIIPSDSPGG